MADFRMKMFRAHPGTSTQPSANDGPVIIQVGLHRESEKGVAFISSADLPELFIVAVESDVRAAIEMGLKAAFDSTDQRADIYTNGSVAGPMISALVKLTATSRENCPLSLR